MIHMPPKFTTVIKMVYARVADVKFKPGMREQGLSIIADIGKDAREGFGGMLILLPTNDEDMATYVTLWDSEEAMNSSWAKISPRATEALKGMLAEPVLMRSTKVREAQKIAIPV